MTFWLSFQASYACRHAGACCSAGWTIPIEALQRRSIQVEIDAGRLEVPQPWIVANSVRPNASGLLALDHGGHCIFHRHDRCAVHSRIGSTSLPSSCQHFPRVCLIDARGTFITLSHYCPTAAATLFDNAQDPVRIVVGPPALPGDVQPEGLDARNALPPLLSARMLMDVDSYGLWERHMVETLTRVEPRRALDRLYADVGTLEQWRPTSGPLIDAVRVVCAKSQDLLAASGGSEDPRQSLLIEVELFRLACHAVPPPLTWPDAPGEIDRIWRAQVAPVWPSLTGVVGRYLAARAFASWVAYQATGLRVVVRAVETALAVLQIEAARQTARTTRVLDADALRESIRRSDLLLVHYADRQALADALSSPTPYCALPSMSS